MESRTFLLFGHLSKVTAACQAPSLRKNVNPSSWRAENHKAPIHWQEDTQKKSNRKRIRLTETQPLTHTDKHSDILGNHTCLIYFYTKLYLYQKSFYWVNCGKRSGNNRYRFTTVVQRKTNAVIIFAFDYDCKHSHNHHSEPACVQGWSVIVVVRTITVAVAIVVVPQSVRIW